MELILDRGRGGGDAALRDRGGVCAEEAKEQQAEAVSQKYTQGQGRQDGADQHDCGKQDSLSIRVRHLQFGGLRAVWRAKSWECLGKLLTIAVRGDDEAIDGGRRDERTADPSTARLFETLRSG